MRTVNGFACRNCADEELAKRGVDPAHPQREFAGDQGPVPSRADASTRLGVNRPQPNGNSGRHLSVRA